MLVYPPRSAAHIGGRNSLQSSPPRWRWARRGLPRLQKQAQMPSKSQGDQLGDGHGAAVRITSCPGCFSGETRGTATFIHTRDITRPVKPGAGRVRTGTRRLDGARAWRMEIVEIGRLFIPTGPHPSTNPLCIRAIPPAPARASTEPAATYHCAAVRCSALPGHARRGGEWRMSVHSATANWSRLRVRLGLAWGDDPLGQAVAKETWNC